MYTVKEKRKQGKRRQKTHETWEPWMTESRSLKCLNKETLKRGLSLRECECRELWKLQRLNSKAVYSWKWVGEISWPKGNRTEWASGVSWDPWYAFYTIFSWWKMKIGGGKVQQFGSEIQKGEAGLERSSLALGVCFDATWVWIVVLINEQF